MHNLNGADSPSDSRFDWAKLLALVAPDPNHLAALAYSTRALVRRREVRSGEDLLRLVLAYAGFGTSLAEIGYWAADQGLASLSCPAISARVGNAVPLLGSLLAEFLARRQAAFPRVPVRVRFIDATTAGRRNARGVEWRLHFGLDLASICIDSVEVTDAHGGETLFRHLAKPGEIMVADAGYAHRNGLGSALEKGAHVIVRTNWQNLPLLDPGRGRLDISQWLLQLGSAGVAERPAIMQTPTGDYNMRLIAKRLPPAAAERARKAAIEKAKKNKHKIDPRTVHAAGFLILVTSLPDEAWTPELVLQLYRARWQIELHIKRMKSILDLDNIRAQRPEVVHACVLAKVILSMVVEDIIRSLGEWKDEWLETDGCPPSLWTLVHACWKCLVSAIQVNLARLPNQLTLPGLRRYLIPPPRKRVNRLAAAQALLNRQTYEVLQLPLPNAALS